MNQDLTYLDTYILQQDMRIRMPKSILTNLNATKGETRFAIYFNSTDNSLVLKKVSTKYSGEQEEHNGK